MSVEVTSAPQRFTIRRKSVPPKLYVEHARDRDRERARAVSLSSSPDSTFFSATNEDLFFQLPTKSHAQPTLSSSPASSVPSSPSVMTPTSSCSSSPFVNYSRPTRQTYHVRAASLQNDYKFPGKQDFIRVPLTEDEDGDFGAWAVPAKHIDPLPIALPLAFPKGGDISRREPRRLRKLSNKPLQSAAKQAELQVYSHRPLHSSELVNVSRLWVVDQRGQGVPFLDFYKDRRTIVILLRHSYNSACQAFCRSLSNLDPSTPIILITPTSHRVIPSYRKALKLPFPMYSDPSRSLYTALGIHRRSTTVSHSHSGRPKASSWHSLLTALRLIPTPPGDTKQLGAEFVLGPGVTDCHFVHRMTEARTHAPISAILSAASGASDTATLASFDTTLTSSGERDRMRLPPIAGDFPVRDADRIKPLQCRPVIPSRPLPSSSHVIGARARAREVAAEQQRTTTGAAGVRL